ASAARAASKNLSVVVRPPSNMVATVSVGATPYHASGSFTYDESAGKDVGTYIDARGQFTVTCKRVTTSAPSGCPLQLDFRRVTTTDGLIRHAYIVFYWGDPSTTDASMGYVYNNVKFGAYSGSVSGDFSGTFSTSQHYRFARWRWCSWGRPEL